MLIKSTTTHLFISATRLANKNLYWFISDKIPLSSHVSNLNQFKSFSQHLLLCLKLEIKYLLLKALCK